MRSAKRGTRTSDVEVTNVSRQGFQVLLGDRELFVSFAEFPWFRDASIGQLVEVSLPHAGHLYWPQLDVDLAVESIELPERYPQVSREAAKVAESAPRKPDRQQPRPRRPAGRAMLPRASRGRSGRLAGDMSPSSPWTMEVDRRAGPAPRSSGWWRSPRTPEARRWSRRAASACHCRPTSSQAGAAATTRDPLRCLAPPRVSGGGQARAGRGTPRAQALRESALAATRQSSAASAARPSGDAAGTPSPSWS